MPIRPGETHTSRNAAAARVAGRRHPQGMPTPTPQSLPSDDDVCSLRLVSWQATSPTADLPRDLRGTSADSPRNLREVQSDGISAWVGRARRPRIERYKLAKARPRASRRQFASSGVNTLPYGPQTDERSAYRVVAIDGYGGVASEGGIRRSPASERAFSSAVCQAPRRPNAW